MTITPTTLSLQEQESLAQKLLERRRKLDEELNNTRTKAIRQEEELKTAARQDEEEITAQLQAAGGPLPQLQHEQKAHPCCHPRKSTDGHNSYH